MQRAPSGLEVGEPERVSVMFQVKDHAGALEEVLRIFKNHNLTRIESRPSKANLDEYDFYVDFEGQEYDPETQSLLGTLEQRCTYMQVMNPKTVPWFPRKISELDSFSGKTLDAGAELESDHPGFSDQNYRDRREVIVANAKAYRHGQVIPRVKYTEEELATWGVVYDKLASLYPRFGCKQFNNILPLLEHNCGYSRDNIPQLQDISEFLSDCTGFSLRPVPGLLSARDFLNALAFRVFFSTQYIRHHSVPLYTPEPDVCHELLGHVPMFADPDFADFSHEVGLASLGASDADIKRLATCYWFSVEFGLCREPDKAGTPDGEVKAYGAGLLSSFGEMEYACAPYRPAGDTDERPELIEWDPVVAAKTTYPITTYQPAYFIADSMKDAKDKMRVFCEDEVKRPFYVKYNPNSQNVHVDRVVARSGYTVVMQTD